MEFLMLYYALDPSKGCKYKKKNYFTLPFARNTSSKHDTSVIPPHIITS